MRYSPEALLDRFYEYKDSRKKVEKQVFDQKKNQMVTRLLDLPLTIVSFCVFAEISKTTLHNYKDNPDYQEVTDRIWQECEADIVDNALMFQNHAEFAKHILIQAHGHSNKQELNLTGNLTVGRGPDLSLEDLDPEKMKLILQKKRELLDLIDKDLITEHDKG